MEEQKEVKKTKKDSIFYKNIKIGRQMIKDEQFEVICKAFLSDKEFLIEIKFDLDRSKFQCWVTHEMIRKSLSFFNKREQAFENALNWVVSTAGLSQNTNLINSKIGD